MTQFDKLLKRLESAGFVISIIKYSDGTTNNAQIYTPAGEDWNIEFEDANAFMDYAAGFNIDDELQMWLEARANGIVGVPDAGVLLKDQKWKKRTLDKIVKGL